MGSFIEDREAGKYLALLYFVVVLARARTCLCSMRLELCLIILFIVQLVLLSYHYSFHRLTERDSTSLTSIMTWTMSSTNNTSSGAGKNDKFTFDSDICTFFEHFFGRLTMQQSSTLRNNDITTVEDMTYLDTETMNQVFEDCFSLLKRRKLLLLISWVKVQDIKSELPSKTLAEMRVEMDTRRNPFQNIPPPPSLQGQEIRIPLGLPSSGSHEQSFTSDGLSRSNQTSSTGGMMAKNSDLNPAPKASALNAGTSSHSNSVSSPVPGTRTNPITLSVCDGLNANSVDNAPGQTSTRKNTSGCNKQSADSHSRSSDGGSTGLCKTPSEKKTKLQSLPTFSGKFGEWNEWKDNVLLKLQQHGLEEYVISDLRPCTEDPVLPKTVYALILTAVIKSNVSSVVRVVPVKTGYHAWNALLNEFEAGDTQYAAAQEIKQIMRSMKISQIKNPQTYINRFANYRIQLREMSPPRDLTDEEAACAFIRGLRKSKFAWLTKQCALERWSYAQCVLKLKSSAGYNNALKNIHSDSSDSDNDDELPEVKSKRGVYKPIQSSQRKSNQNQYQHPFASYNRGPSAPSVQYTMNDLQMMYFNVSRIPDNIWMTLDNALKTQFLSWRRSIRNNPYTPANPSFNPYYQPSTFQQHPYHPTTQTSVNIPQQYVPIGPQKQTAVQNNNSSQTNQNTHPSNLTAPITPREFKRHRPNDAHLSKPALKPPNKNQLGSTMEYYKAVMNNDSVTSRRGDLSELQVNDEEKHTESLESISQDDPFYSLPVVNSGRVCVEDAAVQTVCDGGCSLSTAGHNWKCIDPYGVHIYLRAGVGGKGVGVMELGTCVSVTVSTNNVRVLLVGEDMIIMCKHKMQKESLVLPNHMRRSGVAVDDLDPNVPPIAPNMRGAQTLTLGDHVIQMEFDSSSSVFRTELPTEEEIATLPRLYILKKDCLPGRKDITSRRQKLAFFERLGDCLGGVPDRIVSKTLLNTTQEYPTVPIESSLVPRDHVLPRFPAIRPKRLARLVYTDTFFPTVKSIRGYTCFQLYGIKTEQFIKVYLMSSKGQAVSTFLLFISDLGIPDEVRMDNAHEQGKSKIWRKICELLHVNQSFIETKHSQQNVAERLGFSVIYRGQRMMKFFNAPLCLWCYALEYAALVSEFIATKCNEWRSPFEAIFGFTPDISHIRFIFYEPVEWLLTSKKFPKEKWIPCRFVGVAKTTGDEFTFIVFHPPNKHRKKGITLKRSNIRRRLFKPRDTTKDVTALNGLKNRIEPKGTIAGKLIPETKDLNPMEEKEFESLLLNDKNEIDSDTQIPEPKDTGFIPRELRETEDINELSDTETPNYPDVTTDGFKMIGLRDKSKIKSVNYDETHVSTLKELYKEVKCEQIKKKARHPRNYYDVLVDEIHYCTTALSISKNQ